MRSLDERISDLETRLRQLKARQQQVDTRRRRLQSQQTRKEDTRRKILVGATVLTKVERGEIPEAQLHQWLNDVLVRPDDRKLFEL